MKTIYFWRGINSPQYSNIPGCQGGDVLYEANLGITKAAEAYNPEKVAFTPFASKVIRNELNSLYAKQTRLLNHAPIALHDDLTRSGQSHEFISSFYCLEQSILHDKADAQREIREKEAAKVLSSVMKLLSPRERIARKLSELVKTTQKSVNQCEFPSKLHTSWCSLDSPS